MRTDEELVLAVRAGEAEAFASLVERWTNRCWDIAWRILHDRELAADVAQETLLTAWQQLGRLESPGSFGGWVSRIARNRALDRLAQERRAVPTGDDDALEAAAAELAAGHAVDGDPVAALDSASRQDLVWAAAAALGERDASVLDLHLRHGLEPGELAEELGISANNAHQVLFRLRKRLGGAIRAWLLWRGGRPRCERLEADLAVEGIEAFGAAAVRLIDAHADGCITCDRDRRDVVAPAAMFAAVPVAAMPLALADQVLAGLQAAGVPVPAGGWGAASSDVGGDAGGVGSGGADTGGPDAGGPDAGGPGAAGPDAGGPAANAGGAEAAGPDANAGGADAGGPDAGGPDAGGGGPDAAGADASAGSESADGGHGEHPWATKALISGGVAVMVVLLLWWTAGGSTSPNDAALGVPTADAADTSPDQDRFADQVPDGGSDPRESSAATEVPPLPPVPGGAEDPAVVPLIPTWHPDDLPDDGGDEASDRPADTDDAPGRTRPDEPPPNDQPDDDGGDGAGDPDDPEDPDGGGDGPEPEPEDPAPDAVAVRFDPVRTSNTHVCQEDGAPPGGGTLYYLLTWATQHATSVDVRDASGTTLLSGLPPQAAQVPFCLEYHDTLTLVARAPGEDAHLDENVRPG